MRVSGRRAFPRLQTLGAWLGRLRISKQVAVKVRVAATSPQVLEGVLCHQLKLDVLDQSASTDLRVWTR